jgi:hypothetical protein
MKIKNFFLVMLLSIFTLSTLGGCDLFDSEDDECAAHDISYNYFFNVISNSMSYDINITDENVAIVEMNVTYFIDRCGSPKQRAYYPLPKKILSVKSPERLVGKITGYSCSTELRNFNDEIVIIVELKFSNLLEQIGSRTVRITKNGGELTDGGDDVTWNPKLITSF